MDLSWNGKGRQRMSLIMSFLVKVMVGSSMSPL